jgi:hypothetical protein
MSAMRHERWPEKADTTIVNGLDLFVYDNRAMLVPPPPDRDDVCDIWLDETGLREMAAALLWAAERLASRVSKA